MQSIAKKIRMAKAGDQVSFRDLAQMTGYNHNYLRNVVAGERKASRIVIGAMAAALGLVLNKAEAKWLAR